MERTELTVADVLDLKYLSKWGWSPDGRLIAWLWDDGGINDLWLGEPGSGSVARVTDAVDSVADFAWSPMPFGDLALVIDGDLYLAAPSESPVESWTLRALVKGQDKHSQLAWSPDGTLLAYSRSGRLWLYERATGSHRELKLPGRLTAGWQASGPAGWSPSGGHLAVGFVSEQGWPAVAVVSAAGDCVWRSTLDNPVGGQAWLGPEALLLRSTSRFNTVLDVIQVNLHAGGTSAPAAKVIHHSPGSGKGAVWAGPVAPRPGGGAAALLLEDDGWAHYYLCDQDSGKLAQITGGECEDFGHAGDEPVWRLDGQGLIYSSNRAGLSWRHLWLWDVATGDNCQLTTGEVTDVQPKLSPDGKLLAFVRCDAYRNMDIWVAPVDAPEQAKQLSRSMPPAWTPGNQVRAEEIIYQGAGDWPIHAQLYRPHGWRADEAAKYPALVWVHGGPMRQMRPTWHPMHSYALFHAYHQYLLHQGYVVLVINFRGGIGYGRDFRDGLYHKMGVDDVTDVVEAGRYLKGLPYVDPVRVAVWGLSYGGYMTLHCLTQYPEEFAMGINVAGIWDFPQWTKWVDQKHGRTGGLFKAYLGGAPEESPELYRQASPCSFKDGLSRPLINLHGVADANVDFAQMDRIVLDCVESGREYEAYYYPEELHTFRWRRTWADAFPKIERELARRLGR